ncbi:MAG: ABC transporter ATP-binding protein [Homoserinimonas sp.]
MATEPIAPETRYSLEDGLARFDTLIDQLSSAPEEDPVDADIAISVEEEPPITREPIPEQAPAAPEKSRAEQEPLTRSAARTGGDVALQVTGLLKSFGDTVAVDEIDLSVRSGTIFGIVGPNGAGKTTTLSMITGLLRPDAGEIQLAGTDVWADSSKAKRKMGILPDRLILFDRLTGRQLLHYAGLLHGLDAKTARARTADLVATIGLDEAQHRLVTDYSAGMTKKVALAAAMIHAPRLLVLDEPFESVDTVSAERIIDILNRYVAAGGTVILSSHSMDLIERICDAVAVIVDGRILATGAVADVRGDQSLEERFVDLVETSNAGEDMEWLRSFSD